MSTAETTGSPETLRGLGRRLLGAPVRVQTYKNLLYLLLAFPLGIAYFVGLLTGGTIGVGLLLTWVGLPILLGTLAAAAAVAGFEAHLARRLVGVEAAVPAFLRDLDVREGIALPGDGFLAAVKRLVTAPSTWTAVVLLLAKFVFGIVSFVAVVTSASVTAALLAAPFVYDAPAGTISFLGSAPSGAYTVGSWVVTTLPQALAVAAAGVVFLFVALNLLNALARFHALYTAKLLRVGNRP
jgi:hypothetical protein